MSRLALRSTPRLLARGFVSSDWTSNEYALPVGNKPQNKFERFQDRYRFFTSSHDGSFDGTMWDYQPVPASRMLTRKHPRRLLPNDLLPFAGARWVLPPMNLTRVIFIAFFGVALGWYWWAYEWSDYVGHWGDHIDHGASYHETVSEADLAEPEEFYPAFLHRKRLVPREPYTHLYNRVSHKSMRNGDEYDMAQHLPLGRQWYDTYQQSNTRFSALLPDSQ